VGEQGITILTPGECLELLAQVTVGRVGVSIGALPAILPVHFALLDDSVVFRTWPGTRLDAAANGAVVAFQADAFEPPHPHSWSVLVQGMTSEVTDPGDLAEVDGATRPAGSGEPQARRWVRINPGTLSGRRF
jgi:hypothetical protein